MTKASSDRIVGFDVVRCALPLERPVRIGRTTYRDREYVGLRLRTEGGLEGHAIGYTRGLPLDVMVRDLAGDVLGCRASRRVAVIEGIIASHQNAASALVRAVSLVDIALWDLLARQAGLPLWRLLGGARTRVPLMAVAGYHARERGADSVEAEVRALADEGFRHVKLHIADSELVARLTAGLGQDVRIAVDVGMAWRSLPAALEGCRKLDDLGLAFIEDPFPPERWHLYRGLATRLKTLLAAGEDAAGPERLADLAGVVGVLRADATASGGFGGVLDVAAAAAARGVAVMTHAFPDLHAHLAGSAAIGMVEMIPDAAGVNPVGQLLAQRQRIEAGEIVLSEEPGHGAPLDWEAVLRHARTSTSQNAEDDEEERGCS